MLPSLNTVVDTLSQLGDQTPQIDASRCLNQRHQHAGQCAACGEACPLAAVTFGEAAPQLDASRCQGCAACSAVCPVGALQGRLPPLESWREAHKAARNGAATLVCKAVTGSQFAATRIACLSALPPEFYIALAAAGVRHVQVYTAECAECVFGQSQNQAQHAIATAQGFLAPLGRELQVIQQVGAPPLAEVPQRDFSRRRFLSGMFNPEPSESDAGDTLDALTAAGISWRRALLLDALMRLSVPTETMLPTQAGDWGALEVSKACVGCAMCVPLCPSGALATSTDKQGQVTLWFSPARCTACGLCVRACFKKAITLSKEVSLTAIAAGQFAALWHGKPPANPLKTKPNLDLLQPARDISTIIRRSPE